MHSLLLFATLVSSVALPKPRSVSMPSRMWKDTSAANWNDSFVIRQGGLSAVIGGTPASNVIHVNEDSLWFAGPFHLVNPDAATQMPNIQADIRNGEIADATTLKSYAYQGTLVSRQHYDPLGDLTLAMLAGNGPPANHERWLDLSDGTTGVYYTVGNVTYQRELFGNEHAGVIAMRITSDIQGTCVIQPSPRPR